MHRLRRALLTTLAPLAASVGFAQAQDAVAVAVSIKPVHSLVAGVMAGVGEPALIVRGAASEHGYALRPSDAAALEAAAVVFWIGESLETYLSNTLATKTEDGRVVALGEAEGVVLLPAREGGTWDTHHHEDEAHAEHGHEEEHGEDHGHDDHGHEEHGHEVHGLTDAHVWLDPVNAQAMVREIVAVLTEADPAHAEAYAANGEATLARLDALTREIEAMVAPVKDRPFIAFHDAYQYFERRFGLNGVGSITVSPDIQPGAARLQEIRDRIAELEAVCVFAEPQFEPRLVTTVVDGTAARTGVLDPLGADIADGPDLYFDLMRRNAQSLVDCLGD